MLKLVIFDLDGLMLDTERLYMKTLREACEAYGLTYETELYERVAGSGNEYEKQLYAEYFPHADIDEFYNYLQRIQEERLNNGEYEVKPGLFELIQAIEAQGGIKTAVVTCNTQAMSQKMLGEKGILPRLNGGVYCEMVSECKPSPEGYLRCCEMFGVKPWEALVLEDSAMGLRAALSAGIPTIAVPDIVQPPQNVLDRCYAQCASLNEVIPLLDSLCGSPAGNENNEGNLL